MISFCPGCSLVLLRLFSDLIFSTLIPSNFLEISHSVSPGCTTYVLVEGESAAGEVEAVTVMFVFCGAGAAEACMDGNNQMFSF